MKPLHPEILDASVVLKWFVGAGEGGSAAAVDVLERARVAPPGCFAAPELLVYELHAGLCRKCLRKQDVEDCLRAFFGLGVQLLPPDSELLTLATTLSFAHGLTAYDAAYAAVARHLKGVWLTFDEPAYQRVATLGIAQLLPL